MVYEYYADGDRAVWRRNDGPDAPWVERFAGDGTWNAADLPRSQFDAWPVDEVEAMRVCDVIRQRAAASHVSA